MATFKPDQCHHRDEQNRPDCNRKKFKASSNYCRDHEAEYQAGTYRSPVALRRGQGPRGTGAAKKGRPRAPATRRKAA